jgi:hypothetical protein
MGIHTWTYKKSDKTIEQLEQLIRDKFANTSKYIIVKRGSSKGKKIRRNKSVVDFHKKVIKDLDKGNIVNLLEEEENVSMGITDYLNEFELFRDDNGTLSYYEKVKEFDDMFRCSTFPNTILRSKEETFKFIEDNIKSVWSSDLTAILIFWKDYPDGIIKFD